MQFDLLHVVVSAADVARTSAANGPQLRGKDQSNVIRRQLSGRHARRTGFPAISTHLNFIDFVEILRKRKFGV